MKASGYQWNRVVLVVIAIMLTVALHYAWEMAQAQFFVNHAGDLVSAYALHCLVASFGDLAITAVAYVAAAAVFGRPAWPFVSRWLLPATLWIGLGVILTIAFEWWALSVGRWAYAPAMPTAFGIGLLPLLQWILVPAATLALLRLLIARQPPEERSHHPKVNHPRTLVPDESTKGNEMSDKTSEQESRQTPPRRDF